VEEAATDSPTNKSSRWG